MSKFATRTAVAPAVDPDLERPLRAVLILGAALVLALPAARGYSQWLGWLPLWLLGMPAMAWWALHRFRLPVGLVSRGGRMWTPPRRRGAQARRRVMPARQGFRQVA